MRDKSFDTLPSPGNPDPAEPESGERECLSNDEMLAFAQGRFSETELSRLHAHVDHCDICQRLLSEAVHAVTTEPTEPGDDLDWNTLFLPNTMIAQRYRIQRFIARGGMGEVYEAFDCVLQERVALKTVASTACDSPRAVRRLKAEVQMARRVSHPNVCRIYDLGAHTLERTGAVVHFLTMEFVEGEPLGQRLRGSGPLPLDSALSVARQLLQGLSTAHRAGVLHRDFKSDNVILRMAASAALTPVILDFGLARLLDADAGRLTTGQNLGLVGTLGYMAPEQIEGKPLTTSTDLYAFGVVWFEMLTGRLPFEAETAAAIALHRLHKQPDRPSSLNPEISGAVDQIVLRCLSRFGADRYQAADEILVALDALGEVMSQRNPPGATSPGSRRWAGFGVILALVAGSSVWLAAHRAAPSPASAASAGALPTVPVAPTGRVEPRNDPELAQPPAPHDSGSEISARRDRAETQLARRWNGNQTAVPDESAAPHALGSGRPEPGPAPGPTPSDSAHTGRFADSPTVIVPERSVPKTRPDWEDPFR
jgi:serine/threonine protein kinase